MQQKTYHAQLEDFEHGPPAKTRTNNQSKHVFFKLLLNQMNYSHTMSCSNCLLNLTRNHILQLTCSRQSACKTYMHITASEFWKWPPSHDSQTTKCTNNQSKHVFFKLLLNEMNYSHTMSCSNCLLNLPSNHIPQHTCSRQSACKAYMHITASGFWKWPPSHDSQTTKCTNNQSKHVFFKLLLNEMNYSHTMSCSNCLLNLPSNHIPQHTCSKQSACKAYMHITASGFWKWPPSHDSQTTKCTNNQSKHVFFKLLLNQMNYSHTMSCSNCLLNLPSNHIPQHTCSRQAACKAYMHITASGFWKWPPSHDSQTKTCTNNQSKHVFFELLLNQMHYSHTMSCSNCLLNLTSNHIPQHTCSKQSACKAYMHITASGFWKWPPSRDSQAKTCTKNQSKHVFFKLLLDQMNYSHTMSCSKCLLNLPKNHIPQHTCSRQVACRACMHITFHTVALLQGVHAHRISFFQKYLQLQQIQINLYENKQTHKHHSAHTIFTSRHSKTVHDDFVSVECHHPPCIRPPRQKQSS